MKAPYFYNAHTHVFTLKNVPEKFGKTLMWGILGIVNIAKLRKRKYLPLLLDLMAKIRKKDGDAIERMANIVRHAEGYKEDIKNIKQVHIFESLQSYYPQGTKFISLSMDMEYMNAGEIQQSYEKQTKELEMLKETHSDTFFPFIFADPRRLELTNEPFNGEDNFVEYLKLKLSDKTFSGIKIYPKLGYWPFDIRMKSVYDFAVEKNIPIMTHCSGGPVYYRSFKKQQLGKHPIADEIELGNKYAKEYTAYYTNPLNYHMLMDKEIISEYWKENVDYSKLKICFGHFGGANEWIKYLKNPWIESSGNSLHRKNWSFKEDKYSWLSVICDLIKKYDNIYADISSTLSNDEIFPLLKVLLNSDEKLKKRILFGTDYYMVSTAATERELSVKARSYLGEELFEQIAYHNVEEYLKR